MPSSLGLLLLPLSDWGHWAQSFFHSMIETVQLHKSCFLLRAMKHLKTSQPFLLKSAGTLSWGKTDKIIARTVSQEIRLHSGTLHYSFRRYFNCYIQTHHEVISSENCWGGCSIYAFPWLWTEVSLLSVCLEVIPPPDLPFLSFTPSNTCPESYSSACLCELCFTYGFLWTFQCQPLFWAVCWDIKCWELLLPPWFPPLHPWSALADA